MKLTILFLLLFALASAQNVGINTPTPDPTAALEIQARDKGLLPPRLTTTQRDAIAGPARGLQIYNLDTDCIEFWNGTKWISLCATVAACSPPPASTPGSNSPVCEGYTLNLTATPVVGATYVWSGPNNYSSTAQNPSIATTTLAAAGTYTLRTWLLGCYSDPMTLTVDVEPAQWTYVSDFPGIKRSDPVIFGVDGKLYIGGGYDGSTYYSDFYEYDPATTTWTPRLAVPGPLRYAPSSWSTANYGYTAGGFQLPGTSYSNVYRYNHLADTWSTMASLPTTIVHANVGVSNTLTGGYIAGGKYSSCGSCACYSNELLTYNEAANTWTSTAWSFARRAYPAIVYHGGEVYIGMGQSWDSCPANYTDWWRYNPGTGTWTALAAYPGTAGGKYSYWSDGTYIYVIDNNRTIYRYDPADNTWSAQPCPAPVGGYATFVAGKLYLVDSGNTRRVYAYNP